MSDFIEIRERLDYAPVVEDTTQIPKYQSYDTVRDVKKLRQQIVIPATIMIPFASGIFTNRPMLIVYQFDYTVPSAFRISNLSNIQSQILTNVVTYAGVIWCIICLRWRIGNTVTRILLGAQHISTLLARNFVNFIPFTNQLIPINFVIEFWYGISQVASISGLKTLAPIYINTSITRNPATADDIFNSIIQPVATIDTTGLSNALPEILPITPNSNGPWITN